MWTALAILLGPPLAFGHGEPTPLPPAAEYDIRWFQPEGDPLVDTDPNHLVFNSAPVYVHDIELMDPVTLDTFTFDGILGITISCSGYRSKNFFGAV